MPSNADITVYQKAYDPATRLDRWQATQYLGANWYGKQAVSVGEKGLQAASSYTVRIFTDALLTVSNGDVVVRGLTDEATPLDATECFVVTAVADNRRGSPAMHHWRLEGK